MPEGIIWLNGRCNFKKKKKKQTVTKFDSSMIQDDWHLRVGIQDCFMNSRGIWLQLNIFLSVFVLLVSRQCINYACLHVVQRIKANPSFRRQPGSTWFISYGTSRPTNGRTPTETRQDGSFVLSQEDSGTPLVHWAYCLAGREHAGVVRGTWSFCLKLASPWALK